MSLPPIDPAAIARLLAIQEMMPADQAKIVREVVSQMEPSTLRAWLTSLLAVPLPDALKKVQRTISTSDGKKHITDQLWGLKVEPHPDLYGEFRHLIVGEDGTVVAEVSRPDNESCELIAGYICGLQLKAAKNRTGPT